MNCIDSKELLQLAKSETCHEKPVLVWFPSVAAIDSARRELEQAEGCAKFDGKVDHIVVDGKVVQTDEHSELQSKFIYPRTYSETTRFFLYHRFNEQLADSNLLYIQELQTRTHLPVICCVNVESKEEYPDFDASAFDEYDFVG